MVNETKFIVHHKSCKCKCGLNESVRNSNQKWNHEECQCKCKELHDWGSCEKDYIWIPNTCDSECNKACKTYEYLDIKNCLWEKRLIDDECEDEILNTTETSHDHKKVSYEKIIVLFTRLH